MISKEDTEWASIRDVKRVTARRADPFKLKKIRVRAQYFWPV